LRGRARAWAERYGIKGVEVSMAHDGPYAIAQAMAWGEQGGEKPYTDRRGRL